MLVQNPSWDLGSTMSELSQLPQVLQLLGNSADEVAASLKAQGIQGIRNTARFLNPICRFVQASLTLDPLDVEILDTDRADGSHYETPLPRPALDFLAAFDHQGYPDLKNR